MTVLTNCFNIKRDFWFCYEGYSFITRAVTEFSVFRLNLWLGLTKDLRVIDCCYLVFSSLHSLICLMHYVSLGFFQFFGTKINK